MEIKKEKSRYLEVYEFYKELIISGQMEADMKMPSIRKGAEQFQISRTTMENAYMILAAEGYIISKPQSGYYVTDMAAKYKERLTAKLPEQKKEQEILYDFVSSNVDKESFKFDLWRRYMKSALRQDDRLLSYGEPQGELEFREVLAEYLRNIRNVVCNPQQIVIGAGIQSLLHILCPIIRDRETVTFYNPGFTQGRAVFEDYGFDILEGYSKKNGVYYISASRLRDIGGSLSTRERLMLIKSAAQKQQLIIEDDYNSEFQYSQKIVPSIQGLAGGRGVVYLGTFSKMLLPSIRMSFMILPPELLGEYERKKDFYNQTASKAEQIAITQYIRDGHLMSQIRKSRKIQAAKSEELVRAARKVLGSSVRIYIEESGFRVIMEVRCKLSAEEIEKSARENGVKIKVIPKETGEKKTQIMMASTNVPVKCFEDALHRIKTSLE